ncbi:hypothetical protein I4U23_014186 [Adineta vaga]|nr:hypothetical protein I4U23_014186 [Adineta vaga]
MTVSILDEYCRYYSDFSKILDIYVKSIYPQFHFEFQQLLDASYNIWHRLSDKDKVSLATFLEELNQINSSPKTTTCNAMMNPTSLALNTSSNITSTPKISKTILTKLVSTSPFQIYLKDERKKLIQRHSKLPMREINKRLSKRWQKMSHRMKYNYEYRAYLSKKRLYKKQGKSIELKKPSFIKRMSSRTVQKQVINSSRGNLFVRNK